MRIIEKMKEKFKDNRFISNMIVGTIVSTGVLLTVGGVASCANAVNSNPEDYNNDARYIGGAISIVAGTALGAGGITGYIDNDDEIVDKKDENNEDNTLEK